MSTSSCCNKKILVTGGAGFIGSHLSESLAGMGNDVTVLDDFSITTAHAKPLEKKGVHILKGSVTDFPVVLAACKSKDLVFHLAAMNRAMKSVNDPLLSHAITSTGSLHVLEASRKSNVKKVVNISSSSVYGSSSLLPRRESDPVRPTHPYGAAKLSGEQYARIYYELYGLPTVSLRYFSVYGPRQLGVIPYAAVIPKFMSRISREEPVEVYGDGSQRRNFTFVSDVVDCTIRAALADSANGLTLNVSSEEDVAINDVIGMLEEAMGRKAKVSYLDPLPGEVAANPADISLARNLLGFSPKVDVRKGLQLTLKWYNATS